MSIIKFSKATNNFWKKRINLKWTAWINIFEIAMKVCQSFNNIMNISVDKVHMFTQLLIYPDTTNLLWITEAVFFMKNGREKHLVDLNYNTRSTKKVNSCHHLLNNQWDNLKLALETRACMENKNGYLKDKKAVGKTLKPSMEWNWKKHLHNFM